ncbi:carboxylesterase/lipase family protein [Sphingomonas glacialis]|uniref:Carboxylic ester hydrolase n=1 Tax=Sphingomonas glacialis TaxID=658225 RepID=A0A502FX62_9SPHN|nr:carboxylesterase family protein [Sphingomonas glacialis]TPG53872.1 carboxylesterase [Sphingomonas glacialis]
MKAIMRVLAASSLLASAAAAIAGQVVQVAAMQPVATDPVRTESGLLAGTQRDGGVRAYLGIPYAAPPVGDLRWAPPRAVAWSGVRNADRTGPECMQVLRPHDINHYFGEEAVSEDCLSMNIWAPAQASAAKLPVVVFLYGGGFTIGSSGMPNYGGAEIARRGAVFVNFNYRVGAFGFLAHPELSREQGGHSGNYALMDQIAALRWVKANIAAFGGDPDKVAIIGQSAGALSVASLIFSPEAKGLFRSAVMTSWCNYRDTLPTLAEGEAIGVAVQERLKAGSLAAMRALPADRILAIQSESQLGANVAGVRIGGPIVDGVVLPAQKAALLAAGRINRVPIIASSNTDDIDIAMSPFGKVTTLDAYRATARAAFGAEADAFLQRFPAASDAEAKAAARRVAHLGGFALASQQCAVDQAQVGQATYIDDFARKHPYTPGVRFADQDPATVGAYHTGDIPYWLGTLDVYNSLRRTRDWTPYDRSLATTMMDHLIAFARDGRPGAGWPAWSARDQRELVFGDGVAVRPLDTAGLAWLAAHPVARTPLVPRGSPRD